MIRPLSYTAAGMLLAAILPIWPYGYYMLLRLVVCGAGAYCAWVAWEDDRDPLAVALGITALLFNPFLPVHLTREIWSVLNAGGAAIFIWFAFSRPTN